MKRTLVLVTATALLLAGLAIGQQPVRITFWHAMSGGLGETLTELVGEFQRDNPGIQVELLFQGRYGDLRQKLLAAIASNTHPTMSQAYENWQAQFIEAQAIVDLYELGFTRREAGDIHDLLIANNTWDAKLYGLPFNKSGFVMYYNRDALAGLGLPVPRTWEEAHRAARLLTVDGQGRNATQAGFDRNDIEQYGMTLRPTTELFEYFFFSMGGELMTADGRFQFNSPIGVQALTLLRDLVINERVAKIVDGFVSDDIPASGLGVTFDTSAGRRFNEAAAGRAGFDMGLAPLPAFRSGQDAGNGPIQGTNVVIYAGHPQREQLAALRLARFLVSDEVTAAWAIATNYLPVTKTVTQFDRDFRTYLAEDPSNSAALSQLIHGRFEPRMGEWDSIRFDVLGQAVTQVMRGQAEPRAALDAATQAADRAIGR